MSLTLYLETRYIVVQLVKVKGTFYQLSILFRGMKYSTIHHGYLYEYQKG